jgi:hypothetical protein
LEEDKITPEQISTAFRTLAADKEFITEEDMYRGGMEANVVEYLKQQLPKKEGGYDYSAFVGYVFI